MKTAPLPSHGIDDFNVLLGRMDFFNSLEVSVQKFIETQELEHQRLTISLLKKKREPLINEEDVNADFSPFQ